MRNYSGFDICCMESRNRNLPNFILYMKQDGKREKNEKD